MSTDYNIVLDSITHIGFKVFGFIVLGFRVLGFRVYKLMIMTHYMYMDMYQTSENVAIVMKNTKARTA